jgi:hypothetical protein
LGNVLTPLWGIGGQDIDFLYDAQKIRLRELRLLREFGIGVLN